jgi:SAM-dependent methyltransferase
MLLSPMSEREANVPSSPSFATPRLINGPEECWFYHTMDLPEVGTVTGGWDLRGRFSDYIGHVDLKGKSFLDVGTGSGFSSFEAEKAGAADVISFDADNASQLQRLPWPYPDRPSESEEAVTLDRMKNGYWLAHRLLRSSSQAVYGDIYRLSHHVLQADVVFIGQILIHLRDPLEALREASLVAQKHLVIAEGMIENEAPVGIFCGGREIGNYYSWWQFSPELYRQYLDVLGFDVESRIQNDFYCETLGKYITISTIVARRRA